MEPIQLLERYYNAFIDLQNPKDFFIGMADYFDFANSVPELTPIAEEITAPKKELQEKLKSTGKEAITKLAEIKEELAKYVAEHGIEDAVIKNAFQEYDGWLNEKIVGSQRMPDALHDVLRDVVERLYNIPEHRVFAEHYIEFSQDKSYVRHYLSVPEFTAFQEVEEEENRQRKTALWAQLDEVSGLYSIIKTGRARLKELADKLKKDNKNPLAWEVLNQRIGVEDWNTIEMGAGTTRLFKVDKIRPMLVRLHTHLISRYVVRAFVSEAIDRVTTSATEPLFKPLLLVQNKIGYLRLFDKDAKRRIAGADTRQFLLVKVLFNPLNKLDASYSPTFHSHERVYDAIALPKDKRNNLLKHPATERTAKCDIIGYTIKEIQKNKKLRGYLSFDWNDGKVRMQITLPEGSENAD